jgi:hypothetical protein
VSATALASGVARGLTPVFASISATPAKNRGQSPEEAGAKGKSRHLPGTDPCNSGALSTSGIQSASHRFPMYFSNENKK